MDRKGSKSKYNVEIETSQLARFYSKTTEKLFGVRCRIHKSKIPKFLEFEKRLRSEGISLRRYTDVVLRLLYKWALDKDVGFVPVDTFLSEFGYMRYASVISTETLEVMDESEDRYAELLHSELMVARLFVRRYIENDGNYKFRKAVAELEPMLSPLWLEHYEDNSPRPSEDAIEIITDEFGIHPVDTYLDVVDALI
jgi:hypothetical protein